ncbi:MAG: BON domain-containing protein [Planctomycetaceae bacterium]|nr:BON domain-containing protein [Planctomycetaceae bacterium]
MATIAAEAPHGKTLPQAEQQVRAVAGGLIRGLRVELNGEGHVVVTGRAATYYAKQLATHAVQAVCDVAQVHNDIQVG